MIYRKRKNHNRVLWSSLFRAKLRLHFCFQPVESHKKREGALLKTLDILIGIATVMLLFSMAVTVITQLLVSLCNLRASKLRNGMADLLQHLDPQILDDVAKKISTALLQHPLIADVYGRMGGTIHREELSSLLMDITSSDSHQLDAAGKQVLLKMLAKNGIDKPDATLAAVRKMTLQLEIQAPELATGVRQSIALMRAAESDYIAKINAWFDQTIDRVSARFAVSARMISVVASLIIAIALQIDVIGLANRLSIDDSFRSAVVGQAQNLLGAASSQVSPPNAQSASGAFSQHYYDLLSQAGLISMPTGGFHEWAQNWDWRKAPGILFAACLLSLGAPFWYNALKSLLQLRSTIAEQDDTQRTERQTNQPANTAIATTTIRVPLMGGNEQGDLQAIG